MLFCKPSVLLKFPLIAKSSLNLYELYYISFCSHRSDHSGLWRRHSPVGPSHEIVISAFSAGYQPHTNFRSSQKIIAAVYTTRNIRFHSTLYSHRFDHSPLIMATFCRPIFRKIVLFHRLSILRKFLLSVKVIIHNLYEL